MSSVQKRKRNDTCVVDEPPLKQHKLENDQEHDETCKVDSDYEDEFISDDGQHDEEHTRKCNMCLVEKPKRAFFLHSNGYSYRSRCMECIGKIHDAMTEKKCKKCSQMKPIDQFYNDNSKSDGFMSKCGPCLRSFDNFFAHLRRQAVLHARDRGKMDQKHQNNGTRAEVTITAQDLQDMWNTQNGKCALSGLSMTMDPKQRETVSLERKDPTKGYTKENCILICVLFNAMIQITKEMLFYILHHREQPLTNEEMDQLPLTLMAKRFRYSGFDRRKLTIINFVNLFRKQKGLCAYSGLRLRILPNSPRFKISLERIDRNKGYEESNVLFIIQELNNAGHYENINRAYVEYLKRATQISCDLTIDELEQRFEFDQKQFEKSVAEEKERLCTKCNTKKDLACFGNRYGYKFHICGSCSYKAQYTKTFINPAQKVCRTCKLEKPVTDFKICKNRYCNQCKNCASEYERNRMQRKKLQLSALQTS